MNTAQILQTFMAFLVLINPLAALGYFVSATQYHTAQERRRVSRTASIGVFAIICTSALVGRFILDALGISIASFRMVGGILLFIIAMAMVSGNDNPAKPHADQLTMPESKTAFAVVPLAMPMIIGPGGISTVIIYSSQAANWQEIAGVIAAGLLITLICYFSLQTAARLSRFLGETGMKITNRVMGLLLAAIGIEIIVSALKTLFPLLAR